MIIIVSPFFKNLKSSETTIFTSTGMSFIVGPEPTNDITYDILIGLSFVNADVSPTLGVTSLALAGFANWANYGPIWTTWWLGDCAGDLVIAPLILLWRIAPPRRPVMKPSAMSWSYACTTTVREIEFSSASSRVEGSDSPGGNTRSMMP